MTDLAGALGARQLGTFDGLDVIRTRAIVRNTGDGLSQAFTYDSLLAEVELHPGQRVVVAFECEVDEVAFPRIKGTDGLLERKHVLKAGTAILLDPETHEQQMAQQRDRIREAKERARGIQRFPDDESEEHTNGDSEPPNAPRRPRRPRDA